MTALEILKHALDTNPVYVFVQFTPEERRIIHDALPQWHSFQRELKFGFTHEYSYQSVDQLYQEVLAEIPNRIAENLTQ